MGMRPTHRLCIKRKGKDDKTRTYAGVAWQRDNSFNIVLNPGVVIRWDDEVWLNLYPIDQARSRDEAPAAQDGDDEIPF